ncbi:hypothetical protein [Brevundimonas diminuta]|uniref:hypothetical protein n=1 Tax=Brevundimonas diminuta TaxID=293 RepID=UPI003D9A3BD8
MHVFSAAYHTMRDVGFYNLGVALKLESVLSSTFDNLKISFGINGIEVLKGAGFSFHNANHFSNCEIRHLSGKGFYGGPCTSLRMTALQVESCGTQGDDATGGMKLTFSGAEGHVGLLMHGAYFEDNAGEADIVLTNEGSAYITHVISGVNFNRLTASRYATNCIKSVGKNRIILIGCTFTRVGDYSPSASRPYLNGDADTIFIPIGCTFQDAVERGDVRNLEDYAFAGSVGATGVAAKLPPGWSSTKAATGVYVVTHDLGLTASNHAVTVTANDGNVVTVERAVIAANSFQVITTTPSGTAADSAFTFQLRVI